MRTTLHFYRHYRIEKPPAQQIVELSCTLNTNLTSRHPTRKQPKLLWHIVDTNSLRFIMNMHILRLSQIWTYIRGALATHNLLQWNSLTIRIVTLPK